MTCTHITWRDTENGSGRFHTDSRYVCTLHQ